MKYVVTEPWKAAGIDVRLCEVGDAIHEVFEGAEIEIFQEKSRKTVPSKTLIKKRIPLISKKAGRFEKLLGFARSHSIVTRGSVSLSCATRLHPSRVSKS